MMPNFQNFILFNSTHAALIWHDYRQSSKDSDGLMI